MSKSCGNIILKQIPKIHKVKKGKVFSFWVISALTFRANRKIDCFIAQEKVSYDSILSNHNNLTDRPSRGGLEVERWSDNRTDSALVGSNPV